MSWFTFFVAVVPSVMAVIYFSTHTTEEPAPRVVLSAFLCGTLTILATGAIQSEIVKLVDYGTSTYRYALIVSFVEAAAVEELAKYLVVVALWLTVCRFRDPWEGLVIGVTVSIGFATAENVYYGAREGVVVAADRAFSATLGHAFDGAVMGLLLVFARRHPARRVRFFAAALALPVLLHGLYNFPIFLVDKPKWMIPKFDTTSQAGLILVNFTVTLSSFEIARRLYRRLAARSPHGRV